MSVRLKAAGILLVSIAASRAEAIPAFARKTGMSCSACHTAWPLLNQQGISFRDDGYQLGLQKDDPTTVAPAYVPISLRTLASYQATRLTNQASDNGPITTTTGGVPVPPFVDILTAGTIAPDVSYLLVLTGFNPGEPASVESAWLRLSNLAGTGWLNLKVGKFEPDLPVSPHRNISQTFTPFAYSASFAASGSSTTLDLASNQVGFELDGHDVRSLTRYAVSIFSANDAPFQANAFTHPVLYGHVQRAFEIDSAIVPYLRVGAFGAVGWWPTLYSYEGSTTSAGGTFTPGTPVNGSGRRHKNYFRYGGELSGVFGSMAAPFQWTVVGMGGKEEASSPDADPRVATVDNHFTGGFAEIDWVPFAEIAANPTPWALFARYDVVRYGAPRSPDGSPTTTQPGDLDGFTVGVRRYLAVGPRASAALHLELHTDTTRKTGAADANGKPTDVQQQVVVAGFDFTF
jgi:hypothetical protein